MSNSVFRRRAWAVCAVGMAVAAVGSGQTALVAQVVSAQFVYTFNQGGTVEESSAMTSSTSPFWWVNSGGYLGIGRGRGWTVQGTLPTQDRWRILYSSANPLDTDNGYRPQNIFRLLTRGTWGNMEQEAYFVVNADNLTSSPNRNASNGILLMSRYRDANNLYYAGIRVDGAAVLKKKLNGIYHTLAYAPNVYPGAYHPSGNPNLLPKETWIGLRSRVMNLADGSVHIQLYLDRDWRGIWTLVAEAIDDGTSLGAPITEPGYAGIRTDFMDVTFENFRLRNF